MPTNTCSANKVSQKSFGRIIDKAIAWPRLHNSTGQLALIPADIMAIWESCISHFEGPFCATDSVPLHTLQNDKCNWPFWWKTPEFQFFIAFPFSPDTKPSTRGINTKRHVLSFFRHNISFDSQQDDEIECFEFFHLISSILGKNLLRLDCR